jgi:hypothetical protein
MTVVRWPLDSSPPVVLSVECRFLSSSATFLHILGMQLIWTLNAMTLIEVYSFTWAMRSLALIQLIALGISNLTLRPRAVLNPRQGSIFDFKVLQSFPFLVYFASPLFTFMGSTTRQSSLVMVFESSRFYSHGVPECQCCHQRGQVRLRALSPSNVKCELCNWSCLVWTPCRSFW